jgi:hypothetical protein
MTVKDLLKMSHDDLDALFKTLKSGPIPDGLAKGTAIIGAGRSFSDEIAQLVNIFAWQGKVFDAKRRVLRNKILPFGLQAIVATVSKAPSLVDQTECILIDYSNTSLIAQRVRDEVRRIAPKLYLGKVYWDGRPLIHFALELP